MSTFEINTSEERHNEKKNNLGYMPFLCILNCLTYQMLVERSSLGQQ